MLTGKPLFFFFSFKKKNFDLKSKIDLKLCMFFEVYVLLYICYIPMILALLKVYNALHVSSIDDPNFSESL